LLRVEWLNGLYRFTVANEMLSLLGSIQIDPFSPEHVPETRASPSKTALGEADEEEEESVLRMAWADEDGDVDEGPLGEGEEEAEEEDDQEMELKRQKKIAKKARSGEDLVETRIGKEKKKRKISSSTAEGKSASGKEHRKGKRAKV
jgi:DNA-directed RNA polymerase I subunit RPA43